MSSAYLLVSHGSRDPRAQLALSQLPKLVENQLKTNAILTQGNYREQELNDFSVRKPLVKVATLELTSVPLAERIKLLAQLSSQAGYQKLQIIPLFLAPGIHVQADLPAAVVQAQQAMEAKITLELRPYLGSYEGMVKLLQKQFEQLGGDSRILMVHGSRLQSANQACLTLATQLDAQQAYWSLSPSLEEQVANLVKADKQKIAIMPYFLFPGKITEAIANIQEQLQTKYSTVELIFGQPIGATPALAQLIVEGFII